MKRIIAIIAVLALAGCKTRDVARTMPHDFTVEIGREHYEGEATTTWGASASWNLQEMMKPAED